MLIDHSIYTAETTIVGNCSCALRDELIACQHRAESVGEAVHMDADYVFDANLDDSMTPDTRALLSELINSYPNSQMFIFNP